MQSLIYYRFIHPRSWAPFIYSFTFSPPPPPFFFLPLFLFHSYYNYHYFPFLFLSLSLKQAKRSLCYYPPTCHMESSPRPSQESFNVQGLGFSVRHRWQVGKTVGAWCAWSAHDTLGVSMWHTRGQLWVSTAGTDKPNPPCSPGFLQLKCILCTDWLCKAHFSAIIFPMNFNCKINCYNLNYYLEVRQAPGECVRWLVLSPSDRMLHIGLRNAGKSGKPPVSEKYGLICRVLVLLVYDLDLSFISVDTFLCKVIYLVIACYTS